VEARARASGRGGGLAAQGGVVAIFTAAIWRRSSRARSRAPLPRVTRHRPSRRPSGLLRRGSSRTYGIGGSPLHDARHALDLDRDHLRSASSGVRRAEFLRARPVSSAAIFAYFLADALASATWALPSWTRSSSPTASPTARRSGTTRSSRSPSCVHHPLRGVGSFLSLALGGARRPLARAAESDRPRRRVSPRRGRRRCPVAYAVRQFPARLQPIEVLRRLEFTRNVFLPSRWVAAAVRLPLGRSARARESGAGRGRLLNRPHGELRLLRPEHRPAIAGRCYGDLASALRGSARRRRNRARGAAFPRFGRPGLSHPLEGPPGLPSAMSPSVAGPSFLRLLGVYFYNIPRISDRADRAGVEAPRQLPDLARRC